MDDVASLEKATFLLNLIGKKKSLDSFESLLQPNMEETLTAMLRASPIKDDYLCETTAAQRATEDLIEGLHRSALAEGHNRPVEVEAHLSYIERYLGEPLPAPYKALDASHPWMLLWLANPKIVLLGEPLEPELAARINAKVAKLVVDEGRGGIAGGTAQLGHVALTYAAVLAVALTKDYSVLVPIRENLYSWLLSLKNPDGSFAMHTGGESDTRSTYCVLVVATLLNITTPELVKNTKQWVLLCQTYEGCFAGIPDTEAHGGYTFCAVASLLLLDGASEMDVPRLARWLTQRQMALEGGFSGRTNKLVDACYSFWIGASLVMAETLVGATLFDRLALKAYLQNCCQATGGGFIDKPGKYPDFYHTNYSLCGLSMAEYTYKRHGLQFEAEEAVHGSAYTIAVNPIFGIPLGYENAMMEHFQ